ncbi:transcription factor e2fc [Anaeramoeba ignava]|uniref:Transcription factor e2fc n=1 Tax=Anaeramoeba ignava TaxID=1746090 RepID=A0A9Q0LRZ4_ANAIG|nr:transcription factor e2fc [Anaeramoeba ignava]
MSTPLHKRKVKEHQEQQFLSQKKSNVEKISEIISFLNRWDQGFIDLEKVPRLFENPSLFFQVLDVLEGFGIFSKTESGYTKNTQRDIDQLVVPSNFDYEILQMKQEINKLYNQELFIDRCIEMMQNEPKQMIEKINEKNGIALEDIYKTPELEQQKVFVVKANKIDLNVPPPQNTPTGKIYSLKLTSDQPLEIMEQKKTDSEIGNNSEKENIEVSIRTFF